MTAAASVPASAVKDAFPRHSETTLVGQTSVRASRFALGTAAFGGLFQSVADRDAAETVDAALQAGVRYFDTAPQYGLGRAESRLGRALQGAPRDSFTVSSKVGRVLRPSEISEPTVFADATEGLKDVFDYSERGVTSSFEQSRDRLGLEHIDIVYIHDPENHPEQAIREAYPVLAEWRRAGRISAVGVGTLDAPTASRFLDETDVDVVLLAGGFTLLDRSGADVLAKALDRQVAVVAAGVFNSGVLASPSPAAHFDYHPVSEPVLERARRLGGLLERFDVPLAAGAVQFAARHPAVVSTLVGCRSAEELRDDIDHFDRALPAEIWQALEDDAAEPGSTTPDRSETKREG